MLIYPQGKCLGQLEKTGGSAVVLWTGGLCQQPAYCDINNERALQTSALVTSPSLGGGQQEDGPLMPRVIWVALGLLFNVTTV